GTVSVSILPPIVPARTAESRAAGWLNQRWDGMRTGYAHDLFDRIQRVSNQRARAPALTPNPFRAYRTEARYYCGAPGGVTGPVGYFLPAVPGTGYSFTVRRHALPAVEASRATGHLPAA